MKFIAAHLPLDIIKGTYKQFFGIIAISFVSWAIIIGIFSLSLRALAFHFSIVILALAVMVFFVTLVGYSSFTATFELVRHWPDKISLKKSYLHILHRKKLIFILCLFSASFTAIGFLLFL